MVGPSPLALSLYSTLTDAKMTLPEPTKVKSK